MSDTPNPPPGEDEDDDRFNDGGAQLVVADSDWRTSDEAIAALLKGGKAAYQKWLADNAPTDPEETAGAAVYADNGYLPDGEKRYPLDTRPDALAAWEALTGEPALDYTAKQLKRARQRTARALEQHGVTITSEGWLRTGADLAEAAVLEYWPSIDPIPSRDSGFEVSLHCGPLRVSISAYDVDPHDLDRVARAAAKAATAALAAAKDDDSDRSSLPLEGGRPAFLKDLDDDPDDEDEDDTAADESAASVTTTAATEAATSTQEEPAVADTQNTVTLTQEQFQQLLAGNVGTPAAAAPAVVPTVGAETGAQGTPAAAVETEEQKIERLVAEQLKNAGLAPATETEDQRIERLVNARVTAAVQDVAGNGGIPPRTGFVGTPLPGTAATESTGGYPAGWPRNTDGTPKGHHELSESEREAHVLPALSEHVANALGHRH